MKIYIIPALIFFCSNALAMDHKPSPQNLTLERLQIICHSSGYPLSETIIDTHRQTVLRNKKCTLARLLLPCRRQSRSLQAKL